MLVTFFIVNKNTNEDTSLYFFKFYNRLVNNFPLIVSIIRHNFKYGQRKNINAKIAGESIK